LFGPTNLTSRRLKLSPRKRYIPFLRRTTVLISDLVEPRRLWQGNTSRNQAFLDRVLASAKQGDFSSLTHGTCHIIHPWLDSCTYVEVERFVSVFTWMFPVYGALHVIPMILFKRKQFSKEPLAMLLRSLKGTVRSSTFLSVFVLIYQGEFFVSLEPSAPR
jgi:hypothetical protein